MSDNAGTIIPGEDEGGSQSPTLEAQREEAVKEQARAKGWRPLKEWEGDPAEWVSAKEFMGREKLYSKIHDLKNALTRQSAKAESDIAQIRKHLEQVREIEYKKALEELKRERREAIQAGDAGTAEHLDTRIDELQEERATAKAEAAKAPPAQQGPTQEFVEWKQANPWFESDADMTQVAIEIGVAHANANPSKTQKDVLEYVTRRIKQMNPEKFGKKQPNPSDVESGDGIATRQTGKKGSKVSLGDMSEDERKVYDMYIKRRVFSTQAEKNKRSLQEETLAQMAAVRGQ